MISKGAAQEPPRARLRQSGLRGALPRFGRFDNAVARLRVRGFRYHLAAESLFLDGRVEGGATFGGQPVHAPRDPLQITRSGEVGHGPACTALVDGNAGGRDLRLSASVSLQACATYAFA